MKNKGRKHIGHYDSGRMANCKGSLTWLTRPIRSMSSNGNAHGKYNKKKWIKRIRGYFKTQHWQDIEGYD